MSDDPAQDYRAVGMTEDLITDLSKNSDLFVIARNSTLTYTSKTATIRQVAEKFPDRADILAPSSGCVPNKRLLRVTSSRKRQPGIWTALHRIADVNAQNVRLPYESGRESAMCRTADNCRKETFVWGCFVALWDEKFQDPPIRGRFYTYSSPAQRLTEPVDRLAHQLR